MTDELLQIKNMIYEIRGQKVMLDSDLKKYINFLDILYPGGYL